MRLNVEILGTEQDEPQVLTEEIEAGQLDPLMLVYDPNDDEVDIVAIDPAAYQKTGDGGRVERWVQITLAEIEDMLDLPATSKLTIVYGADPDTLQPMLDADLLTIAQEALASNGMCYEIIGYDEDEDEATPEGEPGPAVYCGLPSSPDSHYRMCPEHDRDRIDQSDRLAARDFRPTYGRIAAV